MIKERKQIPKLFMNFNLDGIYWSRFCSYEYSHLLSKDNCFLICTCNHWWLIIIFQDLNVESDGYLSSFTCTVLKWKIQGILLYSWRFSRYSASFHWLVHGHMTSNNETVSRQMPWAGNIAKAMTSNGKQFTVTRSTVHCWPLLHVIRVCSSSGVMLSPEY